MAAQGTDSTTSAVGCDGDGVTGKRVQALYVYVDGRPNRASSWRGAMRSWAAYVDSMFGNSAAQTGGTARLRWVTNNCLLNLPAVKLSSAAETNFSTMIAELSAAGYGRDDRKYLVWFDSDPSISSSCGLGTISNDDSPGRDNLNNQQTGYARVDFVCWDFAESHELMHTLGGVQLSAPHSSGHWHCTDENDQMCYQDGAEVVLTYPCADSTQSDIFDCNHDDYFSTAPVDGTYLFSHWNTARSDWVVGGEVAPEAPPLTVAVPSVALLDGVGMTASAMLHLAWEEASDPTRLGGYQLQRRKGSGSWSNVTLADDSTTSADLAVTIGATYAFRLRAVDNEGIPGPWAVSPGAVVRRYEENASQVTYVGTFKRRALAGASESYVRKSAAADRVATLTFSGSSVAFVSTTGPNRGTLQVRVDGGDWQAADLYGATMRTRQVVWAAAVAPGTHTLEISLLGSANPLSSGARVDIDAFLVR